MKKFFSKALLSLALVGGLVACQNKNEAEVPETPQSMGDTYMSISFSATAPNGLKATTLKEESDFNSIGEYMGRDKIENVTVFIVSTDEGTVEFKEFDTAGVHDVTGQKGTYKTDAWKVATPGFKDVYVLVNLQNTPIANALKQAQTKAAFETAYAKEYKLTDATGVQALYAKYEKAENKDIIGMNGKSENSIKVEPGVTKETAEAGTKNYAKVAVRRLVAQAAVTQKKGIDLAIKAKRNGVEKTIATLEKLEWDVMQFEQQTYLDPMAISAGKNAMKPQECKTPSYDFAVTDVDAWTQTGTGADGKYFYRAFDGEEVKEFERTGTKEEQVTKIIDTPMKFVTETTHEFGGKLAKDGGTAAPYTAYRKGNTPYVLVCATIKVDDAAWASTDEKDGYAADKDIYLGLIDGKFYTDLDKAKAANVNGAAAAGAPSEKDNVLKYAGGKCYYFAWLNPDVIDKPINSPVIRNNIYHVNITAFSKLGFTGNPLNPGTDGPAPDPDEDTPRPDETLYPVDTHMAVEISIVNWGVHSYDYGF